MSFLKIELDLPNFEKDININITINKDGEVVYKTTTSSPSNSNIEERSLGNIEEEPAVDKQSSPEASEKTSSKDVTKSAKKSKSTTPKSSGGNFMNAEF